MFDVGWPELLVIAIVMIVVVGPKDLPRMLRQFGRTTAKLRAMAGDFRKQFDEALKEAELDEVRNIANEARKFDPRNEIRKHLSPMEKAAQDVRDGFDAAMKPKPSTSAEPASATAHPAKPLKAGPTGMATEAIRSSSVPAVEKSKTTPKPRAKAGVAKAVSPAAAKKSRSAAPRKAAATKPASGKKTSGTSK
ncbi:sec-independent protein translocase protein TatB [Mesorhizobium sp. J18]|uniref:Sec-independent protein translocase protein TatB n=1 Tax=Mesorhizobium sp. J18 TaxID=935263 RepID=UPI00119B0D48|nr:Sec-independent protein translocase protein TatB [Mesorhizobium sp. J18]TWG95547.1 sec-independent protein translocase protein TatB [Mesorhizobium sp. J18]